MNVIESHQFRGTQSILSNEEIGLTFANLRQYLGRLNPMYRRLNSEDDTRPQASRSSAIRKVFVSYSSEDRQFATELVINLQRAGVSAWYSECEIAIGDSIIKKIEQGISTADFLIIILSAASTTSKWVREELDAGITIGIERGAFVLPLLLSDCEIPPLLKARRYADFRDDRQKAFVELAESILPEAEHHPIDWQSMDQLVALDLLSEILSKLIDECKSNGLSKQEISDVVLTKFYHMKQKVDLPTNVFRWYIEVCIEQRRILTHYEFMAQSANYIERNDAAAIDIMGWLAGKLAQGGTFPMTPPM